MNILIFAGTKNGRELILELLSKGYNIFSSSASSYGDSLLPKHNKLTSIIGKKDQSQIENIIIDNNIDLIIDSTHPYAKEVSINIYNASKNTKKETVRFEREKVIPSDIGLRFLSMEEVCLYLKDKEGNILFTTGVNDIPNIVKSIKRDRIYARVLPVKSSLTTIEEASIPIEQVITKNPPFSLNDNIKHIEDFNIKFLVTKDSGAEGNIFEKLEAVKTKNIELLVIERPENLYNIVLFNQIDVIEFVKRIEDRSKI